MTNLKRWKPNQLVILKFFDNPGNVNYEDLKKSIKIKIDITNYKYNSNILYTSAFRHQVSHQSRKGTLTHHQRYKVYLIIYLVIFNRISLQRYINYYFGYINT
jgi:hypothetical protein